MNTENLQYVVGMAKPGEPAIVRFFSAVNADSALRFNEEFLWLQDYVKPSKIIVMINSEGGSVLHGMSMFSTILACPIEVDCVIEGIAASMGSVIWAAGDNLYMHDYSLLMIHNPFNANCDCENDPNAKQMISAFRSQLETVYTKRFGMTKDKVREIMDGEEGVDGTFFTAKEAVKAGLLSKENIIKTTKQVCEKVSNELENMNDQCTMRDFMSTIAAELDDNKLIETISAIHKQKEQIIQEPNEMNEETLNFDAISAQLGFSKDAQVTAVQARVNELLGTESALKDIQNQLDDLKIKYAGKETELENVNNELTETKAALKVYKDAEEAAREAEIVATVEAAVKDGKIDESKKESWIEMAHNNFQLVKDTLASISSRENIEREIATDPENISNIEDTLTDVEKKMKAEVEAHIGKVEFKKF